MLNAMIARKMSATNAPRAFRKNPTNLPNKDLLDPDGAVCSFIGLSSSLIANPAFKFLNRSGISIIARNHSQIRALLGRNISVSWRDLASEERAPQ